MTKEKTNSKVKLRTKKSTKDYSSETYEFTRLNPLNDYLFKQYMGTEECKICLISFLNAVLDLDIKDVTIKENKELPSDNIDGKLGRLDVLAVLEDGTLINIEVQICNEGNIIDRTLFYNFRLYIDSIKKGDNYVNTAKVITINLLNFDYLPFDDFHLSCHLRFDQYPKDILTDKTEIHFIELKKFYKSITFNKNNSLHRWLRFFDQSISDNELKELISMDKAIATAENKAKKVSSDEVEFRYYQAREDARRDYNNALIYATNKGLSEGIEKGKIATRFEVARKLLSIGLSVEQVVEGTNLTMDEIIKLKTEIKKQV